MAPRRSRCNSHAGDSAAPPAKQYKLLNKKFDTLDQLYAAVQDAQTRGTSYYWDSELVRVEKDLSKDEVGQRCLLCQTVYGARNPSESLSRHFRKDEHGAVTCVKQKKAQERIAANLQLASTCRALHSTDKCNAGLHACEYLM
jgi:hypothetical protein